MSVELFKLIMAKPLHGIVAVLCISVSLLTSGLFSISQAQAVMESQQVVNEQYQERQLSMYETVIRTDANVKHNAEQLKVIIEELK